MSTEQTARLGLYRWSSDDDIILREQIDESHASIELYGAKIISGTALPSVGSREYARTFFLNTATKIVYFYSSEDAFGVWTPINTDIILVTLAENKGDILVASGPDQWQILPAGTSGQVLSVVDENSTVGWATLLVTKGDLLTLDGSSLTNLSVGTNNQVLIADSFETNGLKWSQVGTPSLANAAATSTKFQNLSVTSAKFSANAATSIKILDGSITAAKIQNNSASTAKLSDLAVIESKIANGSITEIKIADNAVSSTKFFQGSVVTSKIANLSVGSFEIFQLAVTADKLGNESITTSKIVNSNVLSTHLAAQAATSEKLFPNAVTSGKLTDQSIGSNKIADFSVTTEKIIDSVVGSVQLAASGVVQQKIDTEAVSARALADSSITSAKINNFAVTNEKIATSAITTEKLSPNSVTSGAIRQSAGLSVVGNATGSLQIPSDIIAVSDANVMQRTAGVLGFSNLANGTIVDRSITTAKLVNSALVDSHISSSANINLIKLADGVLPSTISTTTSNYLNRSVTMQKLNSSQTEGGIGVWFDYIPVVRLYAGSFSYPGTILDTSNYTIVYAKYSKINEWVSVRCRIVMNQSFGETSLNNRGACISLPFLPEIKNNSCIGMAFFMNMDTANNQTLAFAMNENSVNSVAFGATLGENTEGNSYHTSLLNWPDQSPGGYPHIIGTFFEQYDQLSFNVQYPTSE
jgi:hypothetical protein